MKVKEIMTKDVVSVDKDDSLKLVLKLMKKHDITKLPVLEEKKLIGIVTDNVIAIKLGSKRKSEVSAERLHASSVVEKEYSTISPDTSITVLLKSVGKPGLTMLPVMDGTQLIGVVTKADLLPLVTSKEPVHSVMQQNVHSVDPEDRVIHARRLMMDNDVARLPVISQGKLVGMISDKEIAFALATLKKSFPRGHQKHQLDELLVKDVMKTPAIWIPPSFRVIDAAKVMLKHNVGALPVVQGDVIKGIVTRTDLLRTLEKKQDEI
jgi:CBS domain-containing protein